MTHFAPGIHGGGSTRGKTANVLACCGCDKPIRRYRVETVNVCGPCRDIFDVSVYGWCHTVGGVGTADPAYWPMLREIRVDPARYGAVVRWARELVAA